jgi:hypothetical protein
LPGQRPRSPELDPITADMTTEMTTDMTADMTAEKRDCT